MYKLILNVLFLIICQQTLIAQDHKNFYFKIYEADKLYEKDDFYGALIKYEAASEMVDFIPSRMLDKFLKVANKAKNKVLKEKYQALIRKQNTCPIESIEIGSKIDSLFVEDQRVRTQNSKLIDYYWKNLDNKSVMNSSKFLNGKKAIEDWGETDSLNIVALLSMFEEFGFLDESKVGFDKYFKIETILLHFDNDKNNKVLQPILDEALINGQISPFTYAKILDRHSNNCCKTQQFWTWTDIRYNLSFFDESEIAKVLKARKSIGLYGTELNVWKHKRGRWMVNNISRGSY